MALPPLIYVPISAFLFSLGIYTLASKRNIIKQLIAVEILVNAAHLNFVVFAVSNPAGIDPYALSLVLISLAVGASIIATGMLLIVHVYRTYGTMDLEALRKLRR